uniref:Calcium-transporting ATPase 4, endoplasmic reticulum-type-like n=1 Tax=Dermatophagoides pteronyssinus TaxID=6956 RepID=A0A6P6YJJ9_DERPT|nr:calcium-transporting ATPase 4, endoplasmic reticulum-type-like [Dermatophagoides pteronyssinus]
MITGDHQLTAEAVARKIGLSGRGAIISRAKPEDKLHIIQIFQENDEIVAMTGDGVNDAPALRRSDIGISLGLSGTEVAKEASDIVLADDNFATIVAAIEEGRAIYSNMKCFIRYLISSNIGEICSIFFAAALGIPDVFLSIQLLWVNLVTDGPPATALSFNRVEPNIMERPPRPPTEPLISSKTLARYCVIGFYVGFATVAVFIWHFTQRTQSGYSPITLGMLRDYGSCAKWADFNPSPYLRRSDAPGYDLCDVFSFGAIKASTLSLTTLVVLELLNALNALSERLSVLSIGVFSNKLLLWALSCSLLIHLAVLYVPPLRAIFHLQPLSLYEWVVVAAFSLPIVLLDEAIKCLLRTAVWKAAMS